MELTDSAGQPQIECGIASRAVRGELESGDLFVVRQTNAGVLLAVVDGLGHGTEAATAAKLAVDALRSGTATSVIGLLRDCHESLKRTRGVVMSLAEINFHEDIVTWLAVGNVEGILLRADHRATPPYEVIMQRGGVVGFRLPPLYASVLSLSHGDSIVMATDGIMSGFELDFPSTLRAQEAADSICQRFAKSNDDALVLVVRYQGGKQ